MMSLRSSLLPLGAAALGLGLLASPAAAQKKKGPDPTAAAKKLGLKVEKWVQADWDGDGKDELITACMGPDGLLVAVFTAEAAPKLEHRFPPARGRKLKKIEAVDLVAPQPSMEVVLELYDENPDEKIKRVRIYSGYRNPREIFSSAIFRSKDKSKRPLHERLPGVVQYGDARAGWYFLDLEGDGTQEIVVRDKPQVLEVKRDSGNAYLLTGVREKVYEFFGRPDKGVFTEREQGRFTDFLPAYEIKDVKASTVYVPKDILDDLKGEALAAAVYQAAEGEEPPEPKVDFTPFLMQVADNKLDTAWAEDVRGPGQGEWVDLDLGESRPIHMVRIVSGCVANKKEFRRHNVAAKYELAFDGRNRTFVDRTDPARPLPPAIGILEVPVKGKKFAKQTLVFFKGDKAARKVRVQLSSVRRQGKANRTCIAEVSIH